MAKDFLQQKANPTGTYIDFTMGRGRDTLFLCELAPRGRVWAFDIQPTALSDTDALLRQQNKKNAVLVLDSHDRFSNYVPEPIDGGMFNLGFLPGGDKTLTTCREITLRAVTGALHALKPGGRIAVTVYPGHREGEAEGEILLKTAQSLSKTSYDAMLFRLLNVFDSPYTLMFEKRQNQSDER
jgi:SAM-dependent methyltransferase